MKIADLLVGEEYAAHRYSSAGHDYNPARVKLLGLVKERWGRTTRTMAQVEILAAGGNWSEAMVGQKAMLALRNIWWPWKLELERRVRSETVKDARAAVLARARAACGTLGLHDERHINASDDVAQAHVIVSVLELEKLAARAEHLVELERLMRMWYANKLGDGSVAPDQAFLVSFESKLMKWTRTHDFSMLEEEKEMVIVESTS